jgi:DNA polymerase (family 10)
MSFNQAVAERLELIAKLLELTGADSFRINANAKAARIIGDLSTDLEPLAQNKAALTALEGIGPKLADKISEFARTRTIAELDQLRAAVPAGLLDIMAIPGLGPKTVRMFWQDAGVTDLAGLQRIIDDGSILNLPRMGAKSVEKIKQSIAFGQQSSQRQPLGVVMPAAERIVGHMLAVPGVTDAQFAGSLRRGKDTVGDVDILVASADPAAAAEAFRTMPGVLRVLSSGDSKSSVVVSLDVDHGRWGPDGEQGPSIQVDLRVVARDAYGAALQYFTGSKDHNVRLRSLAQSKGLTLNEYGLFRDDAPDDKPPQARGIPPLASRTEADIYSSLGIVLIPPELREDHGELALSEPPPLITVADIKAELHAHTTASDGSMTIAELARAAKARGFHTIAVTDHSKSSAIAGGLSDERLRDHIRAVHAARAEVDGITILAGSEVDILADGTLDYDDDLLSQLDVVVASPHTALSQDRAAAMKRLLAAVRHPLVHLLGHPTGRVINRRPGLDIDVAELAAAAREHSVALEINSHWLRLDLRDTHIRAAIGAGCNVSIDCDVHDPRDFDNIRYGVLTARRGSVEPARCVNTWTADRLHGWLRSKRGTKPAAPRHH